MRKPFSIYFILLVCSFAFFAGCTEKNNVNNEPSTKAISLQLHWIPDSHQLGFWVALDKQFYEKKGLKVDVRPGGLDANPIKDALSGSADIGQVGGIEQVCTAVSEGLPLKAIAAIHRETPHALISLSTNPIRDVSDISGKKIAVAYGDTAEVLLKSFLNKANIPESSVTLVPFKFDLTPLLSGEVDAITGFATGQPATIEKQGRIPITLSYASVGISSYGYTLVASNQTIKTKGAEITKFMEASREGWQYAFANPQEAVAIFKKRFGTSVDEKLMLRELELMRVLMLNKDMSLSSWKLEESRVNSVVNYLQSQKQIKNPVQGVAVYDNEFTE